MAVVLARSRLVVLGLALVLLSSGTPHVLSEVAAARSLVTQALGIQRAQAAERQRLPRVGVPPELDHLHALDGPTASGADPAYPLNHTFDADPVSQGTPPDNVGFEDSPESVGTPPTNSDLEAAASTAGTPETNSDFETGDFTGWATAGSPSIQSDHSYWAKLVSGASITSSAFTVDSSTQVLLYDVNFISTTNYSGIEVDVLSGSGYSTTTTLDQVSCYQCGAWSSRYVDLSTYLGQSIKLKVLRYLGDAGVDNLRPAIVFPNTTLTGKGFRITDGSGNDFARIDTGTLLSDAFTVDATAQYATVLVTGMSAASDAFTVKVKYGSGFSSSSTVVTANVSDSWTTARFNVVAWQGQSIKVEVARTVGSIGVDDLGLQTIDIPGWTLDSTATASQLPSGPDGNYLSLAASPSLNAKLTSTAISLPSDAQQLTLQYKGGTAGSSFYVELLTGASFGTTVALAGPIGPNTTDWKTLKVGVGAYAGQTVKFRVRQYFGTGLYDSVGVGELTVPGWQVLTAAGVATGENSHGTYVTAWFNASATYLTSVDLSPGIIDRANLVDARFYSVSYEIGDAPGSLIRVKWYDPASSQNWVVFQDAANSPTGFKTGYFPVYDYMGTDGYLEVQVPVSGKLYQLGDNVALAHLNEPFSDKVGMTVDTATGSFGYQMQDLALPTQNPLVFVRYYTGHSDQLGTLGYRWTHSYDTRLVVLNTDGDAAVLFGSGREEDFDWAHPVGVTPHFEPFDARIHDELVKNGDGSYTLATTNNLLYQFTSAGVLTSFSDLNDNTTTLTRDGSGRVTVVTDPVGRTFTLAYDANGRLASVTDPSTAVVEYGYDASGDLTTVTLPTDAVWTYAYVKHRLVSVTAPDDTVVVTNTLDSYNRVTTQTLADDSTIAIAYDSPAKGATSVTDPNGETAAYYFDQYHRTTDKVDPLGRVVTFQYDSIGNRVRIVDPLDNQWDFSYDSDGNLTGIEDPHGNPTGITWTAQHLPATITDACGNVTTLTYDGDGNVETATNELDETTNWTYDSAGRVLTETDPLDETTTYTYDSDGNRTSKIDPLGHEWSWTYDANGRLTSETDGNGNTTEYEYNELGYPYLIRDALGNEITSFFDLWGRILYQDDQLGNRTRWAYDARGNVVTKEDRAGEDWTYSWDANGNMLSQTDPLGHTTSYAYDASNRLTSVTNALDETTTRGYDDAGHLTSITDALDRVTSFGYDSAGRMVSTTLPNGAVTTGTYDDCNNLLTVTNDLDETTSYSYDAANRKVSMTDALARTTTYAYDAAGHQTGVTDPLDLTVTFAYDAAGRLTSVTDPLDQTTGYSYDDQGNQLTVSDPLSHVTSYVYDALNRVVSVTDPLDRTTSYTFNERGEQTLVTLPSGAETSYAYDDRGLLVSVTDPLDHITSYSYDAAGRRIGMTDPLDRTTTYAYDDANQLTSITDALDGVVSFGYDAAGQRTSLTNPRGKTTSWTYDDLGHVLTETDPLDRTTTYGYDDLGRVTSLTDPRDVTAGYSYDAAGNLTGVSFPNGSISYSYDADNRRTQMVDPTGTTTWTFDDAGRVTAVAAPQGTVGYGYDAAGNRTSLTLPGSRTIDYVYDDAGQLTSQTDWLDRTISFAYDDDGRRTEVARPNGVTTTTTYDLAGRIASIVHGAGLTTLESFSYGYDLAGNRTSVTSGAGTESYTYDALNRLIEVEYPTSDVVEYSYDANGNRLTETVNGGTPTSYSYDDADQLTSDGTLTYSYDEAGNLTGDGVNSYVWDWADRLSSATIGSTTTEYEYDGDGVRVSATTNSTTTDYTWDRESGLPQLVDDGETSYLHAGGIQAEVDGSDDALYHLRDGLGSSRGLTDDGGSLVGTADYDVIGGVRSSTGSTSIFGFTGEQADAETGFVYLRARYLDPSLGRFVSADSVQPNGPGTQGYNRYAYTANNPATWTDPSGHSSASPGEMAWGFFATELLTFLGGLLGEATRVAIPIFATGLAGLAVGIVLVALWIAFAYALVNLITQLFIMYTDPFDYVPEGTLPTGPPLQLDLNDIQEAWADFPKNPEDLAVGAPLLAEAQLILLFSLLSIAETPGGIADDLVEDAADAVCSFSGDTEVATDHGEEPIAEIEPGDRVLAFNERTGQNGYYPVTAVWAHEDQVIERLTIDDEVVETTPEHPFFVDGEGWIAARDLQIRDRVRNAAGDSSEVTAIEIVQQSPTMYNLTVDQAHTYYVGDGLWLVHNTCGTSVNQMRQQVFRGQAPSTVDRVDARNLPMDPEDHIHFTDGYTLLRSGKWRQGLGRVLTNDERNWILRNGWGIPD